jgi:hypothetical protein
MAMPKLETRIERSSDELTIDYRFINGDEAVLLFNILRGPDPAPSLVYTYVTGWRYGLTPADPEPTLVVAKAVQPVENKQVYKPEVPFALALEPGEEWSQTLEMPLPVEYYNPHRAFARVAAKEVVCRSVCFELGYAAREPLAAAAEPREVGDRTCHYLPWKVALDAQTLIASEPVGAEILVRF